MPRGGPRPGAGRKPTGNPHLEIHAFKCSQEEWKSIHQKAFDAGYIKPNGKPNISEYIRAKALEG